MNIGFDAKRIFFNETGLGNYSRTLVQSLRQNFPGNRYYLFTPPVRGKKAQNRKTEFSNFDIVEPTRWIDRMFSPYWRNNSIINEMANCKLDIYHGLSHEIPKAVHKTKIKTVVTIHDLIFLRYPQFYKPWERTEYTKRYLDSCLRADAIIAISDNTKMDIEEYLSVPPEKIHVIYQSAAGVYYEKDNPEKRQNVKKKYNLPDDYLLYVGSLNKRKNLLPLIETLSILKNNHLHLVIVGGGVERNRIENHARELGVLSRVLFLKGVGLEELPFIYRMAKVFIYPSLYEGFGIPIIESLLCETPVIVNHGSCFNEAAGPGAVYVDVTMPDQIAEAIEFLLIDENNKLYARNGLDYVQKFSRFNFANQTFDIYKKVLAK